MSGALAHNPASTAEPFFGRESEIAWLVERLEQGERLLVVHGPPTAGKTALLRQLARQWQGETVVGRYLPIYLDVGQASDWAEASPLLQIAGEVGRCVRAQTGARVPPPEASVFAAEPAAAWRAYVGACAGQVEHRELVLLIDGLDGALDKEQEAARRWLHALLRAPVPIIAAAPDLALVEGVLADGAEAPPALPLGPLDGDAAEALLKAALGKGLQIDPWATRRVLEVTSHYPFYVRRFAEALQECCTVKSILMQPDVDTAQEMLLDRGLPEFAVTWRELTAQEQFVLSSLGALRGTRGAATQYDVRAVCEQYNYTISWDEILVALDRLAGRRILEKLGSNNYRFSLELFGLWVRRHRPPEYVLRDGSWRSGRSLAAHQVARVKRVLGQRPRLLLSAGSVLLVVIVVALQPSLWAGRGRAGERSTPVPEALGAAASTITESVPGTRAAAPTGTLYAPVPQPTYALSGYDLACMSRLDESQPWQLIAVDPLSGEVVPLTRTNSNERTPRWSPTGRQLAFVSDRDGDREVYVMDVGRAVEGQPAAGLLNLSQHPAPDWQPAWSPSGRQVAFSSYRDENWEIYVVDADGNNLTRLTEHPENDFSPSWGPDGQHLVFASRRYADADLFVMEIETRALTQLTTGQWNEFEPAWSPDGQWIAYVTHIEDQGDIFVVRADGSEAVNLTHSPYANDFQPAWTPDSERLIFVSYTAAKGDHDLWSMRRDGSDARVLLDDPRDDLAPNWRRTGP